MKKRILSLLLVLVMLAGMIPAGVITASAESADEVPLRDKITQMMMVDFRYWDENLEDSLPRTGFTVMNDQVRKIVEDNNFGAVILFSNNIQDTEQIFNLIKGFQEAATKNGGTPLMIAADQEGGSVYRLNTGTALPGNMALGATYATHGTKYAKEAGKIIGSELSALGINTNFAPVLDVNNNANNPVIGLRSYSDYAVMVGELAAAEIEGMAQYNLIGCAKHFPGHGDTATDYTYGLPLVNKTLSVLKQNELKPYEVAIEKGVDMIMTAHILYPQLESDKILSSKTGKAESLPATMSDDILTDLLKVNMGFEGIIVTDAMNMAGITANWDTLQSCVIAINAGVDMLCMPVSLYDMEDYAELVTIIDGIEAAVKKGDIPMSRINDAYNRIMKVKQNRGILNYNADEYTLEKANAVVGCEANREMEREISAAAVTVIKNENNVLPLKLTGNSKVLMLVPYNNERGQMIMAWNRAKQAGLIPDGAEVDYFRFNSATISADLKAKLDWADTYIIISEISSTSRMEGKHWLSAAPYAFCDYAKENGKIAIISSVDKPYDVQSYPKADAIVAAYGCKGSSVDPAEALEDGLTSSEAAYGPNIIAAVEVILGTYGAQGKLPLDIPVYDEESNRYLNEISYARGYGLTYDTKREIKIYVGGVGMFDGDYLANGATKTHTIKPSGGYAYYKDGTLTLNNYSYEGKGYQYSEKGWYATVYAEHDLTVELVGTNTLTQTAEQQSDVICVHNLVGNPDLTVDGNGKLIGTADDGIGLNADGDITINGGTIAVTTYYAGIMSWFGNVIINGGDIIAESKKKDVDCIYAGYDVMINGGNVTAIGTTQAIGYGRSVTIAKDLIIRASTTADGELGEYVAANHTTYKKIVITPKPEINNVSVNGTSVDDGGTVTANNRNVTIATNYDGLSDALTAYGCSVKQLSAYYLNGEKINVAALTPADNGDGTYTKSYTRALNPGDELRVESWLEVKWPDGSTDRVDEHTVTVSRPSIAFDFANQNPVGSADETTGLTANSGDTKSYTFNSTAVPSGYYVEKKATLKGLFAGLDADQTVTVKDGSAATLTHTFIKPGLYQLTETLKLYENGSTKVIATKSHVFLIEVAAADPAFVTQPHYEGKGMQTGTNYVSWKLNFTPVKLIARVNIGTAVRPNWKEYELDPTKSFAALMAYSQKYVLYAYYGEGARDYVASNAFSAEKPADFTPAFTKQPVGDQSLGGNPVEVTWATNFVPVKISIMQGTGVKPTMEHSVLDDATATSTLLGASENNYFICAYYSDTEYVTSNKFKITELAPAFTLQPADGVSLGGAYAETSWATNFTPVKLQLVKINSGPNGRPFYTYEELDVDATSCTVEPGFEEYAIRAYYNDTKYVSSEYFSVTEMNYYNAWFYVDDTVLDKVMVLEGDYVERPADPVKDGYTFLGWYTDDGEAYNFAATVTDDVHLTAKFEDVTSTVLKGDLNDDGSVDNLDVEYLLWHTLFPDDYPLNQSGNFNGDGLVNNLDVEHLLWHTLFPDDYPL